MRCSLDIFHLLSDHFQKSDYVAHIAVFVFQSHVNDAAIIGKTIKFCMHFYAPFSELLSDIPRENNISSPAIGKFVNDSVILIQFLFHEFTSLIQVLLKILSPVCLRIFNRKKIQITIPFR